ncbi:hypothetical protein [Aquipuribacter sp. MA13-6]|uniref:hypothetical protein n=1 Tax=unclassified Aquipuribacter TaxID=2635084 RepID=UPI003EEA7B43
MALLCSSLPVAPALSGTVLRLLGPSRGDPRRRPAGRPPPTATRTATPSEARAARGVAAVLVPGLPPEPVLVEALTQVEIASGPLELIILRRTAGFTTDAAHLAAVERAADEDYHALRARLPRLLPAYASDSGVPHVLRTTRGCPGPTDKPSRTLTTRVLRVARGCGASVVVAPHGLMQPLDPALTGILVLTVRTEQPARTSPARPPGPRWP